MSIYVQFGVIITLILIFLMAISLVLIDNDIEEDNEDYDIESISFDDIDGNIEFDNNIGFNDFDFGNIVLDDNTDSMSEISELSNIQSV